MKKAMLFAGLAVAAGTLVAGKVLINEDAENGKVNVSGKVKITDQAKNGKKAYLAEKAVYAPTKKSFKIDPEKYYVASVWVKAVGDKPSYGYLGIMPFDAKGYIQSHYFHGLNGTETELAAPCKPGDTVIKLKNGAKWQARRHWVIAFNAKADKSDLPNRNVSSGIKSIVKKDGVCEVTLLSPIKKAYPAGTKVREHAMGGYIYPALGSVPTKWTKWQGKPIKGSALRKGTTGRLIMLCNYGKFKGQDMLFDDLMIEEVDAPTKK